MKMIDGVELLRKIKNGEINNKTKIKMLNWLTENNDLYVNSKKQLRWVSGQAIVTYDILISGEFEIIEEQGFEEIKPIEVVGCNIKVMDIIIPTESMIIDLLASKINKLIDSVNKINKKLVDKE